MTKIIVCEGSDLSGKSTTVTKLKALLESKGHNVTDFFEPFHDNSLLKHLRDSVISKELTPESQTTVSIALRVNLFQKIEAIRKEGKIDYILIDRSFISNAVYQSHPRLPVSKIIDINLSTMSMYGLNFLPDYLFYFELRHETYLERLKQRSHLEDVETALKDPVNFDKLIGKYQEAVGIVGKLLPRSRVFMLHDDNKCQATKIFNILEDLSKE